METKKQFENRGGIWYPIKEVKEKMTIKQEIKELGKKKRELSSELRKISQELSIKMKSYFGWDK